MGTDTVSQEMVSEGLNCRTPANVAELFDVCKTPPTHCLTSQVNWCCSRVLIGEEKHRDKSVSLTQTKSKVLCIKVPVNPKKKVIAAKMAKNVNTVARGGHTCFMSPEKMISPSHWRSADCLILSITHVGNSMDTA